MRATHTFILRLLIDSDDPRQLRGSIQSIVDNSERTFSNAEAFLALLREMCLEMPSRTESTIDEKEQE